MADRETIMTWLEKCDNGGCSSRCPYDDLGPDKCYITLMTEAIALLKEQEAVEPIITDHIVFGTNRKCSKCNMYLFPAARYCPHCGRLVKWDD